MLSPLLIFSSSVVKLIFTIWELRYGGLLRVVPVSFLRSSHMDGLPFPAPSNDGLCQALVLSYQSRRVSERRGCGIDATYTRALARSSRLPYWGVVREGTWKVGSGSLNNDEGLDETREDHIIGTG